MKKPPTVSQLPERTNHFISRQPRKPAGHRLSSTLWHVHTRRRKLLFLSGSSLFSVGIVFLCLLGCRGSSWFSPGDMAEVVAINGGDKRKVMVAIDESECSHHALVWALDNLKDSLVNSPLVVFMAQPPSQQNLSFAANLGLARMYCPVSAAPDFVNSVKEQHRKLTLALLEKAKEICAARGVSAETITEVGDPKVAICDAVEKNNVTLLILGDHGLGKIKQAILGSVSNYCVQYAKCPVLVVKKAH